MLAKLGTPNWCGPAGGAGEGRRVEEDRTRALIASGYAWGRGANPLRTGPHLPSPFVPSLIPLFPAISFLPIFLAGCEALSIKNSIETIYFHRRRCFVGAYIFVGTEVVLARIFLSAPMF